MNEFAPVQQQDPFAASLAGRRLGRYEVLARLASGGMAAVYIARAIGVAGFERLFAVKALHPHLAHEEEFVTMFLDEARLAARIRHPNVVPTIDISDTQDAGYFLVMDYIEGDHLGALMRQSAKAGERLPRDVTLRIVVDALGGLSAAHELTDDSGQPLNLVHRDISPQNIMVGVDGISRLTDFGVAKAETRLSTTREGQFKGKLAYMSPEHASEGYSDQRSDLFAMATILWECLTGRRLFRAENHAATLNKVCLEPIPTLSSVEPELEPFDAILEKGLARNPDERFQSAAEFSEAIEETAHEIGGVGTQRTVANMVKTVAAEKIENDRELIRTGIEAAVKSRSEKDEAPVPPPVPDQQQKIFGQYAAPEGYVREGAIADQGAAAMVEPLPQYMPAPVEGRRRMVWIMGGVGVALAIGAGVAIVLAGSDQSGGITTSPLESAPLPQPTPMPPATAPAAPVGPQEVTSTSEEKPGEVAQAEDTPADQERITKGSSSEQASKPRRKRRYRRTPTSETVVSTAAPSATPKPQPPPARAKEKRRRKKRPPDDLLISNPYR